MKKRFDLVISADASGEGWGASCGPDKTGGRWTAIEKIHHINYLETLAAFFALKSFVSNRSDIHVHLLLDNTTAIAYLKKFKKFK